MSRTLPQALPVTAGAALAAEQRRWRRSTAARLPLLGLGAAGVQGTLYLAGSTRHGWAALTAWQILWVSFLSPIGTGLLAGLLGRRELLARGGGAWWRPVTGRSAHLAAFALLAGYALLMQAVVLLASLPFGWADGLAVPGPIGHLALVAVVQWAASLALLAVAHQVAIRRGVFLATGLGLIWAMAGTFTAETSTWWLQPWAWTVRAMLPLTGTHANGVPLEPGDPVTSTNSALPVLASVLVAVAVAAPGSRPWRRRPLLQRRRPTLSSALTAAQHRRWVRPGRRAAGPTAALLESLRRTAITPLLVVAATAVPLALWIWTEPGFTQQLVALAVLPLGSTLLPVLAWQASAPAWRALSLHPYSPGVLMGRLATLLVAVVIGFAAFTGAALLLAGAAWRPTLLFILVAASTGSLLTCWHLWLTVRAGLGAAVAVGAVGTLLALVVGGTGLASRLWLFVPWSWASTGTSPAHLSWCLPAAVALVAGLVLGCRSAARDAAARTEVN